MTAGVQLAAHELHGLGMLPLDLTAAARIALDHPDAVARAWLAGEDPFAPARGADNTADPRLRALAGTTLQPTEDLTEDPTEATPAKP